MHVTKPSSMAKTAAQKQKEYRDRKRLQLGKEEYDKKEAELHSKETGQDI